MSQEPTATDMLGVAVAALREIAEAADGADARTYGTIAGSALGIIGNQFAGDSEWTLVPRAVTGPGKGVTVTISPAGAARDIAVDGHSIAGCIIRGQAQLIVGDGDPLLVVNLVPGEIIVKADDHA